MTTNTDDAAALNGEVMPKADPFDPAALRTVAGDVSIEKILTRVPVRKPKRHEFIRVHPDAGYRADVDTIEFEIDGDKETFIVAAGAKHVVADEMRPTRVFTAINKLGMVFLWPVKLPGADNRSRWASESALQAAEQAMSLWVKVMWNRGLGAYEYGRAVGDLGSPQWPDKSFRDLLELGFRDRLIDRPDHPVLRELAGEI